MKTDLHLIPEPWRSVALQLQRRLALGWLLSELFRLIWVCAALTGVVWWLLRLQDSGPKPAWWLGGGCLLASLCWAVDRAASSRVPADKVLSRLDVGWGLNHQLVSAFEGRGNWPRQVPDHPLPVKILWNKGWPAAGVSIICLLLAAWMPLPPEKAEKIIHQIEPPDWKAMETLADSLQENELVDPGDAETVKRNVQSLRDKPREKWYEPSSLEATDQLREQTRLEVMRLENSLSQTAKLLNIAEKTLDAMNLKQKEELQQRIQELQRQLQQGGMKPNNELMNKLAKLNMDQLAQMDENRLQQLENELRERARELREAMAQAGMDGENPFMQPGPGGPGRGGEEAELGLANNPSWLPPEVPVGLTGPEAEELQLGDLLSIGEGEHEEEIVEISETAGSVAQPGGTGEVVWKQDVLPAEEKVLKTFFK